MLYKKSIVNNLMFLMLASFLVFMPRAHASESDPKRDELIRGLERISKETINLRDMRDIRFEKLARDLEDFLKNVSNKIDKESDFYLLNPTNFSTEELCWGLNDTNLLGLEDDFREVSEKYGVNPLLLMAMAKHETGNGTSQLFREKKNLFGFNAVDHDPYNMATKFSTERASIETVARHLKEEYLDPQGAYFNGVSTGGIGISYATDPDWSKKVDSMMVDVASHMLRSYEPYK